MTENTELKLYPSWKQALSDLEAAAIAPGQTIEKDWLCEKFGLVPANTIAESERNAQLFRTAIWQLRETLLSKHNLMLRAVSGIGYRVVEPEMQTGQALRDRGEEIGRALAKLQTEITCIRLDALTDTQRKENADAQAKVGALLVMARKQIGNI